jgi:hypothetical protein
MHGERSWWINRDVIDMDSFRWTITVVVSFGVRKLCLGPEAELPDPIVSALRAIAKKGIR